MNNIEDKRQKLFAIASNQRGYFSAKQALSCGYSHRVQSYHADNGQWAKIDRGVFRLANFPASAHEDLVRWSLWSRNREDIPQAIISHETALAFYEISDIMPGKIHLTVPPRFRKKPPGGCILHKNIISHEFLTDQGGFMVTTPLKTIVDIAAGTMSDDYLEQAMRDAFNKGLLVPKQIIDAKLTPKVKEKVRAIFEKIKKSPIL